MCGFDKSRDKIWTNRFSYKLFLMQMTIKCVRTKLSLIPPHLPHCAGRAPVGCPGHGIWPICARRHRRQTHDKTSTWTSWWQVISGLGGSFSLFFMIIKYILFFVDYHGILTVCHVCVRACFLSKPGLSNPLLQSFTVSLLCGLFSAV